MQASRANQNQHLTIASVEIHGILPLLLSFSVLFLDSRISFYHLKLNSLSFSEYTRDHATQPKV